MQFVVGILGLVALAATFVLAMRGAERGVARALGVPIFRWFEATAPGAGQWKRLLVRLTSAAVPFVICVLMFFVVELVGGTPTLTTAVTVLPASPAYDAGMRDGDRVLVVAGTPVHTWDELRTQLKLRSGPIPLTLERAGQRHEIRVTPRHDRVGVAPISVTRDVGIAEAASRSVRLPLQIVAEAAKSFVGRHQAGERELKGPVGIVRETGNAGQQGPLSVLRFLAALGSYFWPFVAALHVFDAVTGWTFRMTLSDTSLPEPLLRLARLRFSLYFALGCWLAFLLAEVAAAAGLPGAPLVLVLLVPGVWALWPLLWVSIRELWRSAPATLFTSTALPSTAPTRSRTSKRCSPPAPPSTPPVSPEAGGG